MHKEQEILDELTTMNPQQIKDRSKRLIHERDSLVRECFVEAKKKCISASAILTSIESSLLENGARDAQKQIVARLNTLTESFDNAFNSIDGRTISKVKE